MFYSTLKIETECFSEMLATTYQTPRSHVSGDHNMNLHCRETLITLTYVLINKCKLQYQGTFSMRGSLALPSASAGVLLGSLFDLEDGGNIFFRNVGLSQNYMAFELTKPYYSSLQWFS